MPVETVRAVHKNGSRNTEAATRFVRHRMEKKDRPPPFGMLTARVVTHSNIMTARDLLMVGYYM